MNNNDKKVAELEERIEKLEKLVERLVADAEKDGEARDLSGNSVVARYDFSDEKIRNKSGWRICNAENINAENALSFSTIQIERTLGVYCDPILVNENMNVVLDDIKQVHVRLKSNVDATQKCILRVFFATDKHNDWSQSKSVYSQYPAGRECDVYIDTKNRYWTGVLTKLRIAPAEGLKGNIEIDLVELIDSSGSVKYSVDFTKISNLNDTGWDVKNVSDVTHSGGLSFNVDVFEKKKVYTDPYIVKEDLCIDADKVRYIRIKMRADVENTNKSGVYMQVLFKTKDSDFWTQDKSMRFAYTPGYDMDAYMQIKQLFWKGQITALRIDPFENKEGYAKIKLIELLSDIPEDGKEKLLKSRRAHLEDRFIKIYE